MKRVFFILIQYSVFELLYLNFWSRVTTRWSLDWVFQTFFLLLHLCVEKKKEKCLKVDEHLIKIPKHFVYFLKMFWYHCEILVSSILMVKSRYTANYNNAKTFLRCKQTADHFQNVLICQSSCTWWNRKTFWKWYQ